MSGAGEQPLESPYRWLALVGHLVLIAALPLAAYGALLPPNEYRAMGVEGALDCDGPGHVFMLAVPALLIYGGAMVINARRFHRTRNLIVAGICGLICLALAPNLAAAVSEQNRTAAACAADHPAR